MVKCSTLPSHALALSGVSIPIKSQPCGTRAALEQVIGVRSAARSYGSITRAKSCNWCRWYRPVVR